MDTRGYRQPLVMSFRVPAGRCVMSTSSGRFSKNSQRNYIRRSPGYLMIFSLIHADFWNMQMNSKLEDFPGQQILKNDSFQDCWITVLLPKTTGGELEPRIYLNDSIRNWNEGPDLLGRSLMTSRCSNLQGQFSWILTGNESRVIGIYLGPMW